MSKRLQVLMEKEEYESIRRLAKREKLSVGEWVRRTLRRATQETSSRPPEEKLNSIWRACEYDFPTGDIDEMLEDIEKGYNS